MSKTIAVLNRKGGVGKTATAHALGAGLSLRGYKTLFIDLDSQCNLSYSLDALQRPLSSMEILTKTATAEEAITRTEGGDIIPASPSLALADKVIDGKRKEYRLREALEPLSSKYDYIVIDTPPALGVLSTNALTASDLIIIPSMADAYSLQGIGLLFEAIQAVKRYTNPSLEVEGILLTRYKGRAILPRDMKENAEGIAEEIGTKVFNTPIRECIAIQEAQARQKDIYSYDKRSNATADYNAFLDELLGVKKSTKKRFFKNHR